MYFLTKVNHKRCHFDSKDQTKMLFCLKGSDGEGEVTLLTRNEVFLTRPGTPRVHAAEPHLTLLDVHLCQRTFGEVARVAVDLLILHRTVVEVFCQEPQGTGLHRSITVELQSPTLCIEHSEPAHVGMVA